ncbi:MAG: hypothetical protein J5517_10015 [Eubacterium sp.]|nr:hypothetical protein [Eubacterium sp.]
MKNIIKSIVYEMLHSKMVIRLYVLFMLLQALVVILNAEVSPVSGVKETSMVLSDGGVLTYEFPIFILTLIVGVICGEDYRDKVANYEVLSGHSRKSIYLARSLFAIFSAAALCLILSFIPLIAGNLYMGWGSTLKLGDVVARYLLLFFPYLRLAAFLAMITFLIKNQYIMMALGFLIMFGSTLLSDLLGASNYYVSIYNFKMLTEYKSWSIYNIDPVRGLIDYHAYDSSLTSGMVIGTIAVSLAMTAFYLIMGYALFRRDELS